LAIGLYSGGEPKDVKERNVRAPEAGGAQQWTLTRTLSRTRCGRGLREKIAEADYSSSLPSGKAVGTHSFRLTSNDVATYTFAEYIPPPSCGSPKMSRLAVSPPSIIWP
jgi:hypothetical protein